MAYIPTDAMRRKREVSGSAWDAYEALCELSDWETGVVAPGRFSYPKLMELACLKIRTARNAMWELRSMGWIGDGEGGAVRLLVGTFMAEIRERKEAQEEARKRAAMSPTSDTMSPRSDAASPISDTMSPISDTRIYKERARGSSSSLTPSVNSQSHTPPTPSHANGREAPPDGGGVGVLSMPKSRHEKSQCVAWAEDRKAKGGRIDDAYAVGRARWKDGEADDEIATWLEGQKPEAVARSLAAPARPQMGLRAALLHVGSILDINPALDIAGAVAQLDVSPDVREQLLAYDFGKRRAATAPELRAHAPP
jgi:hypothetical protein